MNQSVKLLKCLTGVNSIAGYGVQIEETMCNYIEPISDQIIEDSLGGIFGRKSAESGQYSIIISSHMDEVSFIVTKIDKHGFISFTPVGGWWNQVMLSQEVAITTDSGKGIRSIIGSKPPYVLAPEKRKKPMEIKSMLIDIGVSSKEGAEETGVEVDNMVTPYSEFEVLTNDKYLTTKAFDNRYGCALAVKVLKRLKDENIGINLYSGATVQEEVRLRGAKVAANTIKPDLAMAVDVGTAYDTPGMSGQTSDSKLNGGPVVTMMGAINIARRGSREHIKDIVEKHNIEIQWDATPSGGTDAGSTHVIDEGIPAITIGITLRYVYSNISVLNVNDYENSVRLITEIVCSLNDETCKNIMWQSNPQIIEKVFNMMSCKNQARCPASTRYHAKDLSLLQR